MEETTALNQARVIHDTTVRSIKVSFSGETFVDARGWQFELHDLEADVFIHSPQDYVIDVIAVHGQRMLVNGRPGQILRLIGPYYSPVYAAGRLAVEQYLRERGEIE